MSEWKCGRCGVGPTGHQGHYGRTCRLAPDVDQWHFCCPGSCELDEDIEDDGLCGDCMDGKCHGGDEDDCGCARHAASVKAATERPAW